MALFGDLHIHLSPHLPVVSRTNVFSDDITIGFLLLYAPCAMYHPPPPFLFWPNLWPKWWNISQPLYTYDRERERCKKSGAILPVPEKKRIFFTRFCEGRRRISSRRSKAKPRDNTKGGALPARGVEQWQEGTCNVKHRGT
jgi:hypothetical protein